jgi:hypothetical protein
MKIASLVLNKNSVVILLCFEPPLFSLTKGANIRDKIQSTETSLYGPMMSDVRRVVDHPPSTQYVTATLYYKQSVTPFVVTQINTACISPSRHGNFIPEEKYTITTDRRQSETFGIEKVSLSGVEKLINRSYSPQPRRHAEYDIPNPSILQVKR